MKLMNFQLDALKKLMLAMTEDKKEIVLKAPTGSGKTIIMTHFMDEYIKSNPSTVFMWLTPGKGDLEEQSKRKMDLYIHNSRTKLLADVMTSGFEANDCCFINWEKLTKKGNNALKDGERTNFIEWVEKAIRTGISFKIVIDESHQNYTEKTDAIIQLFKTDKIIRCSATPLVDKQAKLIEISEEDVIAEGLIKKALIINEDFPQTIETENQTNYLLDSALVKYFSLLQEFRKRKVNVNPLIVIQLPNNSDALVSDIEKYLESRSITYENGKLAIWLSKRHENLEDIEKNDSEQIAVIIKQAVATGWDCPRAHILVKLRENMDETFEIQTIGRIRRMPEAHHYDCDLLDNAYLYTFDSKFTEGVINALGSRANVAKTIFLKNEYKTIKLIKEQRSVANAGRDPRKALTAIALFYKDKYGLTLSKSNNKTKLEANRYIFSTDIVRYTLSGKVVHLSELTESERLNVVSFKEPLNTHVHGREYHNRVGRIGLEISMDYAYMNSIILKIFGKKIFYSNNLISLEPKELYAFVINNYDLIIRDVRDAMAKELNQIALDLSSKVEKEFTFPSSMIFTYNDKARVQKVYNKNVYNGYLSSADPRSHGEKEFEKFCESNENIDWWYKNGDKGEEYLSILYLDNSCAQKLFYPDYVVSVKGKIWIIETKGGFSRTGESQNIDIFAEKKFNILKEYLKNHSLNGGIVRFDVESNELLIATESYNDDHHSDSWKLLSEEIEK